MKLTRRKFVEGIASSLFLTGLTQTPARQRVPASPRPNVVFILADDLGWGDLSCYGRPDYRTPNLDRLALQGARLTDAYSASAVCTPTRCSFITGRYPGRLKVGLLEPLTAANSGVGLDPSKF